MIYIVGIGPGHKDYMLNKAINILENSDVVVYMCIANDKECRNLDTSLKKELLKNGLQNKNR